MNSNTPIPHSLITSNNRSRNKQNRKEGKASPQWLRKHRPSQSNRVKDWFGKLLWLQCTLTVWGRDQESKIALVQHHKCCCLALGAKMTRTNQPGGPFTVFSRALDQCLSPLGSGGVNPWHNLWQRFFTLVVSLFLVAKLRCSTQYQLSWGICMQRWLVTPIYSKAGLNLYPRWKESSCRLGKAPKI